MTISQGIRKLSTSQLLDHCSHERQEFRKERDVSSVHCYELFRRALAIRDNQAWEAIYGSFLNQVERWIRKHPANIQASEEVQYFSNRAFEKMWRSITPEKFNRFANLESILAYLKTCIASVLIDDQRKKYADQTKLEALERQDDHSRSESLEDVVFEKSESYELWGLCKRLMNSKQEQIVLFSSFTLVMKPREIFEKYPEQFADVDQVYRTKENILSRLRRNPELSKLAGKAAKKT